RSRHSLMAREGVAEVMEVKILDASPFDRPPERATDGVSVLDGKEAPIEAGGKRPQGLDGGVVQVDFASIAVFGLAERGDLVRPVDRLARQPKKLSSAHPGVEGQENEGSEVQGARFFAFAEQRIDLIKLEESGAPVRFG